MKAKKQYNLDEAIRSFYKTEPLKIDLPTTVANKVTLSPNKITVLLDSLLYGFVAVLACAGLIYSFSLFSHYSFPALYLVAIPVACYFGLSVKEYSLMSKRILSAE